MSRLLSMALGAAAVLAWAPAAHATSAGLFGFGPASSALAQSDIADASAAAAAYVNPAALASPGAHLLIGYAHAFNRMGIEGVSAPRRDIAGTDVGLQLGWRVAEHWTLGGGVAMHLPDRSLARLSFTPGTEPLWVRFEPSAQRITGDAALALRYRGLSVGVGAGLLGHAEGNIGFLMAQDGNGTYADGNADITVPYRLALIGGVSLDLGNAAIAVRYRGSQSMDVGVGTRADVAVTGNPLNGSTVVNLLGSGGYVPTTVDLGARYQLPLRLRLTGALQYARWSQAPSPTAELTEIVSLGMTPGQLEGKFVLPRFRDTISPRLGLQWQPTDASAWVLRAGYQYVPSPVPRQTGFATMVDASTHTLALGVGVDLGKVWGVGLRADAAAQWLMLKTRQFDKPNEALPFAHYDAHGHMSAGSVAIEGSWQ